MELLNRSLKCPLEAVEEFIYNRGRIDVIAALKVSAESLKAN